MYLKSIEVQGFKSFANKILFEFHNGITGIVGPNGSGKSNVGDAVRWVLGEQSAKQLRGSKMEDVIFAGTEARKPLGFAYVAITLDNSDHMLPVEFDEVVISRRVFRSGESEYQINGSNCRLKDVNELFYDTGIGKEGYSIIGQGQVEKILSGKPEERRELFDEAAGIVKFKRRKATAQKKLESERNNLTRVNDILTELEKQVGPLAKQSEKAREYLRYKEDLKMFDVNSFLFESDKIKTILNEVDEKLKIATNDLNESNVSYENTKSEYEIAEQQLNSVNQKIEEVSEILNNTILEKNKLENQINILKEQIKTIEVNDKHYNERMTSVQDEINQKNSQKEGMINEQKDLAIQLDELQNNLGAADSEHKELIEDIEKINSLLEDNKNNMFEYLNQRSNIKTKEQRLETMLEQINIRKAELTSKIIKGKSEENEQDISIKNFTAQLDSINEEAAELIANINELDNKVIDTKSEIATLTGEIDKDQQQYHREKSKLESLRNITERYDGYGNSIRKIMELKNENQGILGVIADIIKVEKKYEIAVETALGGTIQNIVTDNEQTAKNLISYLKENKLGRATFLPLSSISGRNTLEKDPCMSEKGVVGIASNLVRVSFEYENLARYLLGRIVVVDNIDNALLIARKYKYSLRIVTLEGEQLNPGGSMTGGAFKNSSNLLGRRREIEELKTEVTKLTKTIEDKKALVSDKRKIVSESREQLDGFNKLLREKQLNKNTVEMNLKQANEKKNDIINTYSDSKQEVGQIERQITEIKAGMDNIQSEFTEIDELNKTAENNIAELNKKLEELKYAEASHVNSTESIHIHFSELKQKNEFIQQNIDRLDEEIANLNSEIENILVRMGGTANEITEKQEDIAAISESIALASKSIGEFETSIKELKGNRDTITTSHKAFFDKREELSTKIAALDKECYRLNAQKEKQDEQYDSLVNYMWTEYEITLSDARDMRNEELDNLSEIKKNIAQLKSNIKNLGDVNVNSIEEYKSVSERYEFLKGQHDDLIEAEQSLMSVITDLDTGMRAQFETKFNEIKVEFDKVFKELFGGGRGTIELAEGEDILEAGITIISQPPGKKLQNMMQLSGGEKALTAISLLFAIQNLKPSPFCLLDEIEAALDDSNVGRYANYLHKLTKHTQFIVITHRRGTMSAADRLYGITMQEKGVSTLVSVDLIENDLQA